MVQVYLGEKRLLLLCSEEEANHPQQLQVGCGHLHLTQAAVEKVDGQVEGLRLERHHVLFRSGRTFRINQLRKNGADRFRWALFGYFFGYIKTTFVLVCN